MPRLQGSRLIALALLATLLLSIVAPLAYVAEAQAPVKGPAVDRMNVFRVPLENVIEAFKVGIIDVYWFGVRPAQAEVLAATPGVRVITAPAGLTDFILNPAPVQIVRLPGNLDKSAVAKALGVDPIVVRYSFYKADIGKTEAELCALIDPLPSGVEEVWRSDKYNFNPFCILDIRWALQFAVDREKLVREVYRGFADIKWTFYGPDDPVYKELIDLIWALGIGYKPDVAEKSFGDAMKKAGATLGPDGKWYYKGKPVTIVGIIRIEDERLDLGRYFASVLEGLGLTVARKELTFAPAIDAVYGTNPIDFEWHFYTEGWGKGALERWDPGGLTQFGSTLWGYLPGWLEEGYWQYTHELKDKLGKTADDYAEMVWLMKGVKSKDEWVDALRRGTELATRESIRIWGFAVRTAFAVSTAVQGLTEDLGAGLRSPFNCRSWFVPGKSEINVGHLWVWTARTAWNPFGGFLDVYSVDPARCTYDFMIWRHPFTGLPIEFRAKVVEIKTAGPEGKLKVPDDAIWWDVGKKAWVYAKDLGRVEATTVVRFDLSLFLGSKWHYGLPITWADFLGYWATWLDLVYDPTKSKLESRPASLNRPFFDTIVALRPVLDKNILEVYLNFWHFEPMYMADAAALTVPNPFELIAFQDYVAFVTKERALSDTRARAAGIPYLSLALKPDAELARKYFEEGKVTYEDYVKYITLPGGGTLMTKDEWGARVKAVIEWIKRYGNAWIANGPFMLTYYDPDAQRLTLTAFRDPTYPFGPTTWAWGRAGELPRVTVRVLAPLIAPATPATITVTVENMPGREIDVTYTVRDPVTGAVIASGKAELTATGYIIKLPESLTAKLAENSVYELRVVISSEAVALPIEYVTTLQTTLSPARFKEIEEGVTKVAQDLSKRIEEVRAGLSAEVAKSIEALGKTLGDAITDLGTTLSRSLGELRESVRGDVSRVESTLNTVAKTSEDAVTRATGAESTARYALYVSVINLILLLAVVALIYMRRS